MVWLPHTYLRPGVVRRSLDPQLRRLDVRRLWTALATLVDVRHGLRRLDLMQQTVEKLRDTTTPRRRQIGAAQKALSAGNGSAGG